MKSLCKANFNEQLEDAGWEYRYSDLYHHYTHPLMPNRILLYDNHFGDGHELIEGEIARLSRAYYWVKDLCSANFNEQLEDAGWEYRFSVPGPSDQYHYYTHPLMPGRVLIYDDCFGRNHELIEGRVGIRMVEEHYLI